MPELPEVSPGEVIDSSTFGNPVIERVVSRYPDETARDAASPTPSAGEMSFLADINAVEVFNGSAWIPAAQWNHGNVLTVGPTFGYWWRPNPADTTKDWRILPDGDGLILQTRGSGSFGTAIRIESDGTMLFEGAGVQNFAGIFRNVHWGTAPPAGGIGKDGDLYVESPGPTSATKLYIKDAGVWRGA